MAENLGEAQLRLTVDIRAFEESLRQARQLIQQQLGDVTGRPGQTRSSASAAANEINRQQRQQEAADRRRRRADAEEQRRIDRAARQGGAREGVRALEIAQERRFRLARRIDTLEEQGANVARLRVQLGALTEAQSRRQFGSFRQRGQELARQITLEERRLATLRRQERVQRQNAAVGAAMGGARESIFALERAQDRRFKISQRIERLEERGVATQSLRRQLGELTTSYAQRQFGTARQLSRELERQVTLTEARARRERDVQRAVERTARLGGPREPIQGRLDLPGSPRFLAEQRRREERQLRASATAGGPRDSIRGSRNIPGSPAFLEARERLRRQILDRGARQGGASESLLANERAQQRRFALDQRIARLQQQGANVGALQIRLAQLDTALAERQFGSARQITAQLGQQVTLTEARLRRTRELQRLTDRAARVGGPSEPIRGRKDLPGSPAFLEEQRRQEARRAGQGGPASSLATRASLQSAQLSIGAAGLQLQRQGADVTQIKKLYADLDSALRTGELGTAKQITQQLRDQLTVAREKLAATQAQAKAQRDLERRGGPSLPVSGRLINGRVIPGSPADIARQATQAQIRGPAIPVSGRLINGQVIPGSPADLARQRRLQGAQRRLQGAQRSNAALGDALIGGAFPLLFGQGLGASLGGSLGGFTGGKLGGNFGFGLSLLGTAVGAQFDAALAKLKTIGDALNKPVESFQALKEAALLSSRAVEKNIQNLIDNGKTAEAALQIQIDFVKRFGSTKEINNLAAAQDELNRTYSELGVTTAKLVAGPMAALLGVLNRALGGKPTGPGANQRIGEGDFRTTVDDVKAQYGQQAAAQILLRRNTLAAFKVVPDVETANKVALDEARQRGVIADRQRRTQQEINALEARAVALAKERAAASQLDYRITQATAQGYKLQLFYLQQQKIIRDRDLAIKDNPSKAASIREQAKKDLFANQEERRAYLRQQVERLKPAPVQEINNIRATIDAARKDRQAAFTNYSNLLNDPKASRPEQLAAGKELVAAAIAFKTAMVDGARQIADVVTGAANRLTQARLELSGIQANPDEGLNRFLRPEQRQVRLNTATARLGPDLERSISIASKILKEQGLSLDNSLINELRSIIAGSRGDKKQFGTINGKPFFGAAGPDASVASFKKVDDFITAVQKENESRNNLSTAQADVAAINKELLGVNSVLAKQVGKLAEKTWAVTVNVDSGGGVTTFGNVLNSAVQ